MLPAHLYQQGKTLWSSAPYATSAIATADERGNRIPLSEPTTSELSDYGAFQTYWWSDGRVCRAWIYREGADTALWYKEASKGALRRALNKAVAVQVEVEKARGSVTHAPETVDLLRKERTW